MNQHQRAFIRIIGALIFFSGFLMTYYISGNPGIKEKTLQANYLCNLQIGDTNFGELGQQILNKQTECSRAKKLSFIINYHFLLYFIGITIFLVGIYFSLEEKTKKRN